MYTVRPERPEEYEGINNLIKTAFSTAKVKDGDEQDFASRLRKGAGYIPELALVMEHDGRLMAHIMLTVTYIATPRGNLESLLLAPVSVLAEYRNRGLGTALIEESLDRAANMGYKSVFLCGDPDYYHRLGFRSVAGFGISIKSGIPLRYVMVRELEKGALDDICGTIDIC